MQKKKKKERNRTTFVQTLYLSKMVLLFRIKTSPDHYENTPI